MLYRDRALNVVNMLKHPIGRHFAHRVDWVVDGSEFRVEVARKKYVVEANDR